MNCSLDTIDYFEGNLSASCLNWKHKGFTCFLDLSFSRSEKSHYYSIQHKWKKNWLNGYLILKMMQNFLFIVTSKTNESALIFAQYYFIWIIFRCDWRSSAKTRCYNITDKISTLFHQIIVLDFYQKYLNGLLKKTNKCFMFNI